MRGLQQEGEGGRRVLHHGGLRGGVDRQAVAGSVVEQAVGLAQRDGPGELDGDARAVGEQTQRGGRGDRENLRGLLPRGGLEGEGDAGRRRGERDLAGLVEEKTPENVAGGRRGERAEGLLGGREAADADRPGVVGMERRRGIFQRGGIFRIGWWIGVRCRVRSSSRGRFRFISSLRPSLRFKSGPRLRFGFKRSVRFEFGSRFRVRLARSESTTRLCGDGSPEAHENGRGASIEDVELEFGRVERLGDDLRLVLNSELGVIGDSPRDAIARIGMQSAHGKRGEVPIEQRVRHVLVLLAEDIEDGHVDPRGDGHVQHAQSEIRVFRNDLNARNDRWERVERRAGLQVRTAHVLGLGLHVYDDPSIAFRNGHGNHGEFMTGGHAGADRTDLDMRGVQRSELAWTGGGHAESKDDLAIDERATGEPGDSDEVDGDEGGGDVEGELGTERSGLEGEEGRFDRETRGFVQRERVGGLIDALRKERARNRHVSDLATRTVRHFVIFTREFFAPYKRSHAFRRGNRHQREQKRSGRQCSAVRKHNPERGSTRCIHRDEKRRLDLHAGISHDDVLNEASVQQDRSIPRRYADFVGNRRLQRIAMHVRPLRRKRPIPRGTHRHLEVCAGHIPQIEHEQTIGCVQRKPKLRTRLHSARVFHRLPLPLRVAFPPHPPHERAPAPHLHALPRGSLRKRQRPDAFRGAGERPAVPHRLAPLAHPAAPPPHRALEPLRALPDRVGIAGRAGPVGFRGAGAAAELDGPPLAVLAAAARHGGLEGLVNAGDGEKRTGAGARPGHAEAELRRAGAELAVVAEKDPVAGGGAPARDGAEEGRGAGLVDERVGQRLRPVDGLRVADRGALAGGEGGRGGEREGVAGGVEDRGLRGRADDVRRAGQQTRGEEILAGQRGTRGLGVLMVRKKRRVGYMIRSRGKRSARRRVPRLSGGLRRDRPRGGRNPRGSRGRRWLRGAGRGLRSRRCARRRPRRCRRARRRAEEGRKGRGDGDRR